MQQLKRKLSSFWKEEDGLGTLEILLIIAVLVVIAVVFRKWIIAWVESLFDSTQNELDSNNLKPKSP